MGFMCCSYSFLFIITGLLFINVRGSNYNDAEKLLWNLFQNYSTDIRPNKNLSETTVVSLYPFIFSLNDFDEVSGVISIVSGLLLQWHDFRLTWTPGHYGGIKDLLIPKKKLWIPNVFLINPANTMKAIGSDDYLGRIYHTGLVQWSPGGLFESLCDVNMYKFPFDTQSCAFILSLWDYVPTEAVLVPDNNVFYMDTTYYSSNSLWKLESTTMKFSELVTSNYTSIIELRINLRRKSLYFVINMLAPILLLSILNPLVFALPVDSGERVSYAITIFLSFAVFLTLISENMPKSSEPMSLLSYFLIVTMTMSTLICILTIVTMRFHFKDPSLKVSKTAASILKVLQLRFLCISCDKGKRKSQIRDVSKLDDGFVGNKEDSKGEPLRIENEKTWKGLAVQYDRVLMCYFFLIVFLQWIILSIVLSV